MPLPFIGKRQTLEDATEENERLKVQAENEDLKFTIAQRQAMAQKLKDAGLTKKSFGSWTAVWRWLNRPMGGKK